MTVGIFSYLMMTVYLLGLFFVQRKFLFFPMLPIQIVCGPYFIVKTLTDGWSGSGTSIFILASISILLSILTKKNKIFLSQTLVILLASIFLPIVYGLLLSSFYSNKLDNVVVEIIPLVEFLFFLCWTYFYINSASCYKNIKQVFFVNFHYVATFSAMTTLFFYILFPNDVLFGLVASGGEISPRMTDFIGPIAVITAACNLIDRSAVLSKKRAVNNLLNIGILVVGALVAMLGMYRSVWLALVVTMIFMSFKLREFFLLLGIGVAFLFICLFLIPINGVVSRLTETSISSNARVEQAYLVLKKMENRPWGSGLGATILFADKSDATKDGPGAYMIGQRPYKGNYYLSLLFFMGPTIIPAALNLFFIIFLYGFREKTVRGLLPLLIGIYFGIVLLSFPSVLHYPILAICGVLLALMFTGSNNRDISGFYYHC